MHTFEIYILDKELTAEHWRKLHLTISQYIGVLKSYEIQMRVEENVVRYFLTADKDISVLSNNLEGMVIRSVPDSETELPSSRGKERFLRLVTGGNFLDFREKYQVKRNKEANVLFCKVRQINPDKSIVSMQVFIKGAGDTWSVASKRAFTFPSHLFAANFNTNTKYLLRQIPKYLNIEKSLNILKSENDNAVFSINTFPYFNKDYYLSLGSYDFDKHSLIVGASGSGKSKFIEIFIEKMSKMGLHQNYRVIVIDPHASIAENMGHIPDSINVNFKNDSSDLFPASNDVTAATELSATLFKSLLGDQFNPKVERVLRFSLYVLYSADKMDFHALKQFLDDLSFRTEIVNNTADLPPNIVQFFSTDFNELKTKYYNEAILPIISLVDEVELLPTVSQPSSVSLAQTIQNNFLTIFSLNKVSMGEKVVKTLAGLLIQNIFLLAQARQFSQKLILIIDEVSVIQNPALASILAEARKFNLSVILTQQYLSQVDKELRDAIFSNTYNYYAFKVSEEDAKQLEGNLNIEIPDELLKEAKEKGQKEADYRVKIMTELDSREALIRVYANGQYMPGVKARTVDAHSEEGQQAMRTPNKEARTAKEKLKTLNPKGLATADMTAENMDTFQIPTAKTEPLSPQPQPSQPQMKSTTFPVSASDLILEYTTNSKFQRKDKDGQK